MVTLDPVVEISTTPQDAGLQVAEGGGGIQVAALGRYSGSREEGMRGNIQVAAGWRSPGRRRWGRYPGRRIGEVSR